MEIMQNVKFEDIYAPFEENSRVTYDEDSLRELANSIDKDGLSHLLTVRRATEKDGTDRPLVLVAGFRRYLAMTKLLKKEATNVHLTEMDGVEAAIFGLNENLARVDITTYEKARSLVLIRDKYGIGPKEISKRLSGDDVQTGKPGFKPQTIGNLMRIMDKLCDEVKEEWKNNHPRATTLTLLAIIRKETTEEQIALWKEYVSGSTMEDEEENDEGSDEGDEDGDDEGAGAGTPAPARPSKHKIIEAIAAIRESKHSKEWKDAAIIALEWAAGSRKRLPGVSAAAKKPAKKEK